MARNKPHPPPTQHSAGFHPEKQGTIYYIKLRALDNQKNVDDRPSSVLGTAPWTSTFAHQFYNKTLFHTLYAYGVYSTATALNQMFPDKMDDEKLSGLEESVKDKLRDSGLKSNEEKNDGCDDSSDMSCLFFFYFF